MPADNTLIEDLELIVERLVRFLKPTMAANKNSASLMTRKSHVGFKWFTYKTTLQMIRTIFKNRNCREPINKKELPTNYKTTNRANGAKRIPAEVSLGEKMALVPRQTHVQ